MATPTVRELVHSSTTGGGGTSIVTGDTTAIGDTLVTCHASDYGTLAAMTSPTGTAGTWTLEAFGDLGTNACHMKLWTRTVTSAGQQTVNVNGQGLGEETYMHTYVIAGTSGVDDAAAGTTGAGNTSAAPSVVTTESDDLLLCFWHTSNNVVTFTAPPGMTDMTEEDAAGWTTLATAREVLTSSGATGVRTATASVSSSGYVVASIALKGIISAPAMFSGWGVPIK